MSEKRIACYICSGCGLGERLDIAQLTALAKNDARVHAVKTHTHLCGDDGVAMIRADIAGENSVTAAAENQNSEASPVTHVCLAACSGRAQRQAFRFHDVVSSRVNLREGVLWSQPDASGCADERNDLAADYLRIGLAELDAQPIPSRIAEQGYTNHILIIGGGVTGMSAAQHAARAGYRVTLVEREAMLGGELARMRARSPECPPFADPQDTGADELRAELSAEPRVQILLSATVRRIRGAAGRYLVQIDSAQTGPLSENVGVVILATGFTPYDAGELDGFGYRDSKDVITQAELEQLATDARHAALSNGGDDAIKRPSDGREVRRVAFVQCAGQRSDQPGELAYCSRHCCATAMKQAIYFKDQNPAINTTLIYDELRIDAQPGEDFYRSAQHRGVRFTQGRVGAITVAGSGPSLRYQDRLLGEERQIEADLVVLATGMLARPESDAAAENGDAAEGVPDMIKAGSAGRPMTISECRDDAAAAVLQAIQLLERAAQPQPRTESGAISEDQRLQRAISAMPQSDGKTLVIACEQQASAALDLAAQTSFTRAGNGRTGTGWPSSARIVTVACANRISNAQIDAVMAQSTRAFQAVLVLGCKHACESPKPPEDESTRVTVRRIPVAIDDYAGLPGKLTAMIAATETAPGADARSTKSTPDPQRPNADQRRAEQQAEHHD